MNECDYSNHPVSVVVISVIIVVNFLLFQLLLNRFTDLLQIICGYFFGQPLQSLLEQGCYPIFG